MQIVPSIAIKRLAIKLRPSAEKMVKKSHPWIFADSIVKQNTTANAGDIAIVYDQKKNSILAIGLYDPFSPIRIKLLQFKKPAQINSDWFLQTLQNAYALRVPLLATATNSYRLLYGENDHMPGFITDVYAGVAVIKLYAAIWFPYLNQIIPHIIQVTKCTTVVIRLSRNVQALEQTYGIYDGQVVYGTLTNEVIVFEEHGIQFSANVIKGHKTGYFLDHRHNRKRVGELSNGKTVLDVFSYAGGFSVHALAGGATAVTSVDISKQALQMAAKNAALNTHSGIHTCMAVDAFEGLQQLIDQRQKFDVVVIDPPSFAKREAEIGKAKNSYARLARLGTQLVTSGGVLVLASCSSRVLATDFFEICEQNMKAMGAFFKIESKTYHDVDHPVIFPEGAYLKCAYYRLG